MKAGLPKDTPWKDNEFEVEELRPFGQRYFAMYSNGEFGMHDAAGMPLGAHLTLRPGLPTASNIQVTDVAVSPKGLVAVARGPVVTVYQLNGTVLRR